MKIKITDKIVLKAGAALLSFGMLFGSFVWVNPMQVSAAETDHDYNGQTYTAELGEEELDPYVTPVYVEGKLFMGTDALTDPVKVTSYQGSYYMPDTYVYFGETYSSEFDANVPIMLRVLDSYADNAGNSGAMFVMTEYADELPTIFSQYRKYDDEKYYGLYATENVYNLSVPYSYINSYVSDDYRGKLTLHFPNLGEEIDYIRPVTVTDRLAEMEGLYGYGYDTGMHWEVDDKYDSSQIYAVDRDEMTYVNNQKFFLLSAKEMYDHVSEMPASSVMAAKKIGSDEYVNYWLRTGLDFGGAAENGNYVGAVDVSGNIIPYDSGEIAYLRYGFNIETEDIQFMYAVDDNAYRLTFIDPTYKQAIANADPENGIDDRFAASLVDIQDGVATVKVGNVIRNARNVTYSGSDEDLGISVIIKDSRGVVTYYAKVVDNIYSSNYTDNAGAISKEVSTIKFRLPEGIDYENDEVYVFWEMTQPLAESVTFISNMVKLECLHPHATEADCQNPWTCPDCGEVGLINENNHKSVDISIYYVDEDKDTHWNLCDDCGAHVNVEVCAFGEDCRFDCVCGNSDYPAEKHSFAGNGICDNNKKHFESPTLEYNHNLRHVTVRIYNEGQLIAFAKLLNGGSFEDSYYFTVFIEDDLDFYGIVGFEPIGTEEHPFNGYVSGKKFTIENLDYSTDGKYAALFGCVTDIDIRYLNVEDCSFESSLYASVLVARCLGEGNKNISLDSLSVMGCSASAYGDGGKEGMLIAEARDNISVNNVYSLGVTNEDGEYIRFFCDPELYENISVSRSATLYAECGEYGEYDAAAYASGEVAHLMGKGQKIGVDEYPSTDTPSAEEGTRVFKVTDCAGELLRFTNEYLSIHALHDYTEHRITKFYEFIWHDYLLSADASVYCEACDEDIMIPAEITMTDVQAPVRVDCVATVIVNGEEYSSEPKRFISTRLQDMIGMTNRVVEFTGNGISPEELMDNHRLVESPSGLKEYEAYFLDPVTGEKLTRLEYDYYGQPVYLPAGVYLPGTYDLLVVGQRAYEGQEYVYEDALIITPITVCVTVADVYKYYDGSSEFTPIFSVDSDLYGYVFDVVLSPASSSAVGEYDLQVGVELWDESYASGIEVIFSKDVVRGYIFPQLKATVENKNYPTEFTYGDTIPTPTAENFNVSEDCELKFEWFEAEYDFSEGDIATARLDSKPSAAGYYILRVTATSESFVTCVYELPITINKKQLTLKIDGGEVIINEYGDEIYVLDMYETLDITVEGFVNGDTAYSVGAFVDYYQDSYYLPEINDRYVFPYQPLNGYYGNVYTVRVYGDLENYYSDDCNYERAYNVIYVIINAPDSPTPVFGDDDLENGEAKELGVAYSWNHPISFREGESVRFYGTVTKDGEIYDEFELSGDEYLEDNVYRMLKITEAGEYSIDIKARYTSEYDYIENYNVNVSFNVELVNDKGEQLEEIRELGDYTVKVTSSSGDVREIDVTVCREIRMQIKPFSYEHSVGFPEFDIKNFVLEAGKVVLIGHEIVDVEYEFYYDSGSIGVKGVIVVDAEGNDVSHLYKVYPYDSTDIHVFDSPCDDTCNVSRCEHVRFAVHSGGVATCSTLAVCDNCRNEYGSYQPHRHASEYTVLSPNFNDGMTHNELYTCCGAVKSTVGHTPSVAATCTSLAICAGCGWAYGEFDYNNHSSHEMSYVASAEDANTHITTHVCCHASFTEEHTGGVATCTAAAICEKCNTGYGEMDADNHVNVTYTNIDGSTHLAQCNDCSSETVEAHSGGVASCKTLAVCEACSSSYGEFDSENHESNETKYVLREENPSMHDYVHSCCGGLISKSYHSGGEANCISPAICEYCGDQYGNRDPENHASEEFAYRQNPDDQLSHIKLYACCRVEIGVEAHNVAESANCYHGDICSICGIEYSEKTGHVYDDANDTQCNVCGKEIPSVNVDISVGGTETGKNENNETQPADPEENDSEKNESEQNESEQSESEQSESEQNDSLGDGGNGGGCKSTVGFTAVTVMVALLVACPVFFKKKQD